MKKLTILIILFSHTMAFISQTMSTVPSGLRLITPAHYSYGCAVASDGSVFFTEFNHQQLRQVLPNGIVQVRRMGLSGMFGLTFDTSGNLFVGRDLGDVGNPSKITRITPSGVETDIVVGITRPRGLTTDASGNVYFATESPSRISRWNKIAGTVDVLVNCSYAAEGVAIASDGSIYFSEYGDPAAGVYGTVKKRATNGTITTILNTGIWRCRGLVINGSNDYLYLCTEADQADHGNSGYLAKIRISDGTWTKALEGIDYPQFPSLGPDGNVYFSLTRENWVVKYNTTATTNVNDWSGNSTVKIGISEGQWTSGGTTNTLTIKVGKTLSFTGHISPSVTNGTVHGWIRIPEGLITLDSTLLYLPCYTSEHSVPGIYRLPSITYDTDSGSCFISAVALRSHIGQRWPMQNPGTCNESPAAGFDEKPTAYLIYFSWNKTDRVNTILSPSYNESGSKTTIVKGSEPGWIYSGCAWNASGQSWLSSGKSQSAPDATSWAEMDLGAFSGKSKYIYVMWHKNGPYRPNATRFRLYDYTEERFNPTVDETKHADNLNHGDDTFSGWYLIGNKRINITPSTKLRVFQDAPVASSEYLQSDAILLSDYPIVDNTSFGSASNFEFNPVLSVTSTGVTGVGSHWGMQGVGYQYSTTNGKSFANKLDKNIFTDLNDENYYVEVSWNYLNTDVVNVTNARYTVNGLQTSDIINQNRSSSNQSGSFVQGNSVGTWSGFYRLNGTFAHTSTNNLILNASYNSTLYNSKRFVYDMVRFIPVDNEFKRFNAITDFDENENLASEELKRKQVTVYPNPFVDVIKFNINADITADVKIRIFNVLGQTVQILYLKNGVSDFDWNGSKLKSGTYYYDVTINGVKENGVLLKK